MVVRSNTLMEQIKNYFPHLSADQYSRLDRLEELYPFWNARSMSYPGKIFPISASIISSFLKRGQDNLIQPEHVSWTRVQAEDFRGFPWLFFSGDGIHPGGFNREKDQGSVGNHRRTSTGKCHSLRSRIEDVTGSFDFVTVRQ